MMRFNSKKIKGKIQHSIELKINMVKWRAAIHIHMQPNSPYRSNQYPIAEIVEISSYHFTVLTRLPCYVGCSSRIWFGDRIITHIPLNEKKNIQRFKSSCPYSSYHFTVLTRLLHYVGCSSRIWFRDRIITHIFLNKKIIYINKGLRQIVERNIYK
jgi:hypothetical protein